MKTAGMSTLFWKSFGEKQKQFFLPFNTHSPPTHSLVTLGKTFFKCAFLRQILPNRLALHLWGHSWFESLHTNLRWEIGKLSVPGISPLFFGLCTILDVVFTKTPTDEWPLMMIMVLTFCCNLGLCSLRWTHEQVEPDYVFAEDFVTYLRKSSLENPFRCFDLIFKYMINADSY